MEKHSLQLGGEQGVQELPRVKGVPLATTADG